MGVYIDLVVVAIVLVFGIVGLFSGFFKSVLSLLGFFGAAVLAIVFRQQIANLLNTLFNLQGTIETFISTKLGELSPQLVVDMANKEEMITAINATDLNSILKGIFGGLAMKADFAIPISVADIIVTPIANLCVEAVGVTALFALIRLAVVILNLTLGKIIKKAKVIGGVNKFLGFALGLIKGGFFVAALMAIVSVISLIPSVAEFVSTNIESTYITKYGYEFVNDVIVDKLTELTGGANTEELEEAEEDSESEGGAEEEPPV